MEPVPIFPEVLGEADSGWRLWVNSSHFRAVVPQRRDGFAICSRPTPLELMWCERIDRRENLLPIGGSATPKMHLLDIGAGGMRPGQSCAVLSGPRNLRVDLSYG